MLGKGKWHELTSIFHGWATLAKSDKDAPLRMEALLKRLLEEQQVAFRLEKEQENNKSNSNNRSALQMVDIGLYNT